MNGHYYVVPKTRRATLLIKDVQYPIEDKHKGIFYLQLRYDWGVAWLIVISYHWLFANLRYRVTVNTIMEQSPAEKRHDSLPAVAPWHYLNHVSDLYRINHVQYLLTLSCTSFSAYLWENRLTDVLMDTSDLSHKVARQRVQNRA